MTFLTTVASKVFILTFSKENFKIDPTKITEFLQPLQNTDITCVSDPIKCIPNIKDALFQLKKRKTKKKNCNWFSTKQSLKTKITNTTQNNSYGNIVEAFHVNITNNTTVALTRCTCSRFVSLWNRQQLRNISIWITQAQHNTAYSQNENSHTFNRRQGSHSNYRIWFRNLFFLLDDCTQNCFSEKWQAWWRKKTNILQTVRHAGQG